MAIEWKLKKWLAVERNIFRPVELQALLKEKAGVELSLQAISTLMNHEPSALRLQTIQALCTALECDVCDFFNVSPEKAITRKERKATGTEGRRLYGGGTSDRDSSFPDPNDYFSDV